MRRTSFILLAALVAFGCALPLNSGAATRRTRAKKVWTPPKVVDLLPRYPGGVLQTELVLEKGYILPAVAKFASEALGINLSDRASRGPANAKERQTASDLKALAGAIKNVEAVYLNEVAFPRGVDPAEVLAFFARSDAAKSMKRVLYHADEDGAVTSIWAAWGGKDLLVVHVAPDEKPGSSGRMLYSARIQGTIDLTKLLQIPTVRAMFLSKPSGS